MNSGLPCSRSATEFTYAPQAASPARFGAFSPGFFHMLSG